MRAGRQDRRTRCNTNGTMETQGKWLNSKYWSRNMKIILGFPAEYKGVSGIAVLRGKFITFPPILIALKVFLKNFDDSFFVCKNTSLLYM